MDLHKFKKYNASQFVRYEQTGWLYKCEYAKPIEIFFRDSKIVKIICYNKHGNTPIEQYFIEFKDEMPTSGEIISAYRDMSPAECEEFVQMLHDSLDESKFDNITYE